MGCGGPSPDGTEDTGPDITADAPEIDMAAAEDDSEDRAVELAVDLTDTARILAGEIEGATTETEPPAPSAPPKTPEGRIDSEAVQQLFADKQGALQQCYERALKRSPDLAGRISLLVDINPDGSPDNVKATADTLQSDQVNSCIEQTVREWTFPEPNDGAARIQKPLSFSPKQ